MWSACPIFRATSAPVFISFARKTLAKELVNDVELEYESHSPDPPEPSNFPTLYRPSTRTKLGWKVTCRLLDPVVFCEVRWRIVGNKIESKLERQTHHKIYKCNGRSRLCKRSQRSRDPCLEMQDHPRSWDGCKARRRLETFVRTQYYHRLG